MRHGVVGAYGSVAQQIALAQAAEETGWDGYFTWDGISIGAMDTWDPFTLLGAIAAITQRITLGALVVATPRHHPWELARKTLTVDHLSGGRLVALRRFGGECGFRRGEWWVGVEVPEDQERPSFRIDSRGPRRVSRYGVR